MFSFQGAAARSLRSWLDVLLGLEVGAVAISSFDTYLAHGLPQIKQRAGLA